MRPTTKTQPSSSPQEVEEREETTPTPTENKPRKLREPKFLNEVDLTAATTPLEDFIELKNPSTLSEKYLVIAQWFKEFLATPEITLDHIFTAFDSLGWRAQVPQDASAPLRKLKFSHLMDTGGRGTYEFNWNRHRKK